MEILTPEQLGITNEEWVNLAESLLISREFVSMLHSGALYDLHKMQLEYLEKFFGITHEPGVEDSPNR